jgi:hypothetical protein
MYFYCTFKCTKNSHIGIKKKVIFLYASKKTDQEDNFRVAFFCVEFKLNIVNLTFQT